METCDTIFNFNENELECKGAKNTIKEIHQQPRIWIKTLEVIKGLKEEVKNFLDKLPQGEIDIILTGAGSSEFVGQMAFPYLSEITNYQARVYGTTDIVSAPEKYISKTKPTLLISFARSGNSPESVAAVDIAQKVNKNLFNIFVTCNKDGSLAQFGQGREDSLVVNLPEETHDKGFAMTSSVTSMFLATILIFNIDKLEEFEVSVREASSRVEYLYDNNLMNLIGEILNFDFNRIVFLGSHGLKGVAEEAALKFLELTAGKVVSKYDSPMGFRHGPKSILNKETLTVVYLAKDEYTRKYDLDVVRELSSEGNRILVVSHKQDKEAEGLATYFYSFNNGETIREEMLDIEFLVIAQMIATMKSIAYNITPDNPSPSGIVNRVVKGVIIHPLENI